MVATRKEVILSEVTQIQKDNSDYVLTSKWIISC